MWKRIFMYLFLFSLLLVLFQYMNEKSIYETQEAKIKLLQEQVIKGTDSIEVLNLKIQELNRKNEIEADKE